MMKRWLLGTYFKREVWVSAPRGNITETFSKEMLPFGDKGKNKKFPCSRENYNLLYSSVL